LPIRYINVTNFHWIAAPTVGETVIHDTFQLFDVMTKMPIEKLEPIIGENLPHRLSLQSVNGRTVEGSKVMDLVAMTAIKKSIMNHGASLKFPSSTTRPRNDNPY